MRDDLARQFVEAIASHDLAAAEEYLHPDVEIETPRGTFHGATAFRRVLEKVTAGHEHLEAERGEPEFDELDGDILARTHEIGRWRESGEVAFERDFAVRLTFKDDRIIRVRVIPGGRPSGPSVRRLLLPSATDYHDPPTPLAL